VAPPTIGPLVLVDPETDERKYPAPIGRRVTAPPRDDVTRVGEQDILDLVAAHDEREMARLLLDERARVEEARSILAELLPALSGGRELGRDTLVRARAFIDSS